MLRLLVILALVVSSAGCTGDAQEPAGASTSTSAAAAVTEGAGLVTVAGDESVEATVDRIRSAAEAAGARVTVIDHAAAGREAGLELPPTTLLLVGNPAAGTPLMQEVRTVAIDLPQKFLVWEDGGRVRVAYNDPAYLAGRHGLSADVEAMAATLRRLATGSDE